MSGVEELPSRWTWATLAEIGDLFSGGTPKTKEPQNFDGDIPWITPADLTGYTEKTIARGRRNITQRGLETSSATVMPARTVVFSSRAPIGYVAIARNRIATNQGFKSVSVHEGIFDEYVYYYLRSAKQLAEANASGTTFKEISGSRFGKLPIPVAPLNEQRRIVEKIETLFARLDKGEEAVREVQKLLIHYRQSVLKAAVTGQLTADWRAERNGSLENGHDVLDRILEDRRENWKGRGRYKEPSAPDTSGMPHIPDGWTWGTLEQLGYVLSGQTPKGVEEHVVEGGEVPWFKVSSMTEPGNENYLLTSKWMFTEESARLAKLNPLPSGTIAFPKRGGAILTNKKRRLGVPGALDLNTMGYVPVALADYLWVYFQGLDLRQIYDGSNVPQINYHDIADLFIAVPSEEEAQVIADQVDDRLSQITTLEAWCETELKRSGSLRQSILRNAFAGRLVPQDPTDEPSSDLLARIAADKTPTKKTRRRASV